MCGGGRPRSSDSRASIGAFIDSPRRRTGSRIILNGHDPDRLLRYAPSVKIFCRNSTAAGARRWLPGILALRVSNGAQFGRQRRSFRHCAIYVLTDQQIKRLITIIMAMAIESGL